MRLKIARRLDIVIEIRRVRCGTCCMYINTVANSVLVQLYVTMTFCNSFSYET